MIRLIFWEDMILVRSEKENPRCHRPWICRVRLCSTEQLTDTDVDYVVNREVGQCEKTDIKWGSATTDLMPQEHSRDQNDGSSVYIPPF